jgi:hypothetical protein
MPKFGQFLFVVGIAIVSLVGCEIRTLKESVAPNDRDSTLVKNLAKPADYIITLSKSKASVRLNVAPDYQEVKRPEDLRQYHVDVTGQLAPPRKYQLERIDLALPEEKLSWSLSSTDANFRDTSVKTGQEYKYRVTEYSETSPREVVETAEVTLRIPLDVVLDSDSANDVLQINAHRIYQTAQSKVSTGGMPLRWNADEWYVEEGAKIGLGLPAAPSNSLPWIEIFAMYAQGKITVAPDHRLEIPEDKNKNVIRISSQPTEIRVPHGENLKIKLEMAEGLYSYRNAGKNRPVIVQLGAHRFFGVLGRLIPESQIARYYSPISKYDNTDHFDLSILSPISGMVHSFSFTGKGRPFTAFVDGWIGERGMIFGLDNIIRTLVQEGLYPHDRPVSEDRSQWSSELLYLSAIIETLEKLNTRLLENNLTVDLDSTGDKLRLSPELKEFLERVTETPGPLISLASAYHINHLAIRFRISPSIATDGIVLYLPSPGPNGVPTFLKKLELQELPLVTIPRPKSPIH